MTSSARNSPHGRPAPLARPRGRACRASHAKQPLARALRAGEGGAAAQRWEGEGALSRTNPHWGTTLDEFLDAEGIRGAAKAEALTRIIAWQLTQEMPRQGLTKATLAERMHTSRAQLDRILKAPSRSKPCTASPPSSAANSASS
jgi:antitoxin HicB